VFTDNRLSLTCEVSECGTQWVLTRESGRVPVCKLSASAISRVAARSCIVVRVMRPKCMRSDRVADACIAELSAESVLWAQEEVLPAVRGLVSEAVEGHGVCVEVELCSETYTVWRKLWEKCLLANGDTRCPKWVFREGYKGLWPYGRLHWFSGVTDAVDNSDSGRASWLRCVGCAGGRVCAVE
jgi:hypothetical protein